MRLRSSPKLFGTQRIAGAAETLRSAAKILPKIGVTRLADITGLDRIGIPVYSAIVPRSNDVISIYNGKGARKIDAKAGAVMEAVERHAALSIDKELVYGSWNSLRLQRRVLDPGEVNLQLSGKYKHDRVLGWIEGFDLLMSEPVLVPAELAAINAGGKYGFPCYTVGTTNGLASGNTMEEAICHALCELIERDAWTFAELLSHWLPLAKQERQGGTPAEEFADDVDRYHSIDLKGAPDRIRRLLNGFHRAGLRPLLKEITSDLGIPAVLATVTEEVAADLPRAHFGLGTHPDAGVAVSRALTELAQSRLTDIHGVREDMASANGDNPLLVGHTRRVRRINPRGWYHREPSCRRDFPAIVSHVFNDTLDDINLILSRLRSGSLQSAIVIDLTHREVQIPVVRVIVPSIESWASDRSRIGWRATQAWRAASGE